MLGAVVKAAKGPEEQSTYKKQIVDSLVAAYQTGLFDAGAKVIDQLVADDKSGKLAPYAAFRKIGADFAARERRGNMMANQKKWMGDLKDIPRQVSRSDEAPDALLQLGSGFEFNAEEDEARAFTPARRELPGDRAG